MRLLAAAVEGRGVVDPTAPVFEAGDEALLRGRAAFETTRVYGGVPFRLEEHLERLAASATRLQLPPPAAAAARSLAAAAIGAAGAPDAALRIFWTGAVLVATVAAIPAELEELRMRGIRLVSLPLGVEADRPPWLLGGVKSTSYAVNMAAEAEAHRRGADDAVFVAAGDVVLELPVSNVWWRRGGTLYTPALDLGVLAGVTRSTVLELAPRAGFAVVEGRYGIDELRCADEAFASSSIRELLPVVQLDGAAVGDGRPGAAARALQSALRALAVPS